MTRRNRQSQRQQAAAKPTADAIVRDSFQNLEARLGFGTANQSTAGGFGFDFISRNKTLLEAAYQSNWMAGVAVDIVAEDMTREGVEIQTSLDPDEVEQIQQAMQDQGCWDQLCDNVKWSRLYGGSIAVLLIDGQNLSTPLRVDTIKKDQFKGLQIYDRHMVQPTLNDIVSQLGEGFGQPRFYDVLAGIGVPFAGKRIHHSRVIRIEGADLPFQRKQTENGWGTSVLEKLWDRIIAFDSATQGAAQLVYKAHLRTLSVEKLRDIIAAGGPAFDGLIKQIENIRRFQSNEGLTVIDSKDTFEAHQYTFSGLADMILQFGQQLAGALQVPLVRLFGQSPAGLNATGDADLKTYQDNIARQQNRKLRSGIGKLLDIVSRSTLGKPLPDGTTFLFRALYQLSAVEKADVAQKTTDTVLAAFDAGVTDRATTLKELRQSAHQTGVWSNITDEQIEEAENEPPPVPESTETAPNDPATTKPGQQGPNARSRQEEGAEAA